MNLLYLLAPGVGMGGGGETATLVGVWANPIDCRSTNERIDAQSSNARIEYWSSNERTET